MSAGAVRESRLWAWLSKARPLLRLNLHMNRVENSIMEGMPDVEGCLLGRQFWIELKCEARPSNPRKKVRPKFRPAQLPWLKRRMAAGGRAFILLQVGSGASANRYLLPADIGDSLLKGIREEKLKDLAVLDPRAPAIEILHAAAEIEFSSPP